ncbi:MAG TPA: ATP-binding protein [Vicinamibacterales bacterium]|nr:ATP-binding protein [Vicinamibacterales bacterium]
MLRLSLRYQLALMLVIVNMALTAGVALVTYRAAHDAMVDQALDAVSIVAQSRERELADMLEHRQERLVGFLQSLQSLCGEARPRGGFGFEDECVHTAAGGFHRSERAQSTDITNRGHALERVGAPASVPSPAAGQLLRIDAGAGSGRYAMEAALGGLAVHVEFPLDDVNAVFADRAGLESGGEAFLTDAEGYRLTSPTGVTTRQHPVAMAALAPCVRGAAQATQTSDDRGVEVIAGLLPAGALGGGCIVANVRYDDATAPIRRLGRLLVYASGLVGLLGGVVSIAVASVATRPLKRLADAARNLGSGRFDTRVPVEGAAEIRQLGRTLSTMASSISTLVQQEKDARRDAETANRTKDEFLATLSHELRTPLNAILGWASILTRSDYDKARVSHAVHVIERNARIQSQMIEELLDVSRISSGTVQLNTTAVAIGSVVETAVDSVRPAAEAKGVSLAKHIAVPDLVINADARRLQQVAWNLLSNAVRFTPAGGRVDVTLARDGDEVELRVCDTGLGIAPEFLPHVFERFRQADSSTTRAHGGLGLGLAIVHDLVALHGGSVRAESAGEGQGATFVVRLPAVAPQAGPAGWPAAPVAGLSLNGARVLLVDDDADTRDVLKTLLEAAGADVMASASAGETRRLFARSHPDLLIADIGMPDEDGYALIASIRQMETGTSHVPAIALTARTRPEDVEEALAAGFQLHLSKPVDSRRLVESVASLVGPGV